MGGDETHIDTVEVQRVGDRLVSASSELRSGAGGVDRAVPGVPQDVFGLRSLIVRCDEAREAFDARVADLLAGAGERALMQVLDATAADRRLPLLGLPEAAR